MDAPATYVRTRKWIARLLAVTALAAGFGAPVYVVTHASEFDEDPPIPADLQR